MAAHLVCFRRVVPRLAAGASEVGLSWRLMSTFYRIAVVGARRRRQGIGAFIAARFVELGHEVCAIVGASRDGLASASDALKRDLGVKA